MTALEAFIAADALNLVALLGVVFIGLPHGAMDGAVAMHFGWTNRPTSTVLFLSMSKSRHRCSTRASIS